MPTNILVVEDEAVVADDICEALVRFGYSVCDTAASADEALRVAFSGSPSLALLDIRIRGDVDGIGAAHRLRELGIPVVFLTSYSDQSTLERARVTTPFGYLLKPFDEEELRATIEMALFKHAADREVRQAKDRYRALFNDNPWPAFVVDAGTRRFLEVNDAALALYGHARGDLLSSSVSLLDDRLAARIESLAAGAHAANLGVCSHRRKDGLVVEVDVAINAIQVAGRKVMLIVARDVTTQRRLERHLRQVPRMDVVGNLNAMKTEVFDPNKVIDELSDMLCRLLGENIEFVTRLAPSPGMVRAEHGRIEQIVTSLVVNARDAMPRGGALTIETASVRLDASYAAANVDAKIGPHVMLAISDTGGGIERATAPSIFEPFFMTRELGRGTGLGLATVYDVVQQSGGHMRVDREVGRGTTFRVYFPTVDAVTPEALGGLRAHLMPGGSETVLIVEDEEPIRSAASRVLRRCGYEVIEAQDGEGALLLWVEHGAKIDLLLTDAVLPKLSGPEVVARLRPIHPDLKILVMSGPPGTALLPREGACGDLPFLPKPFTPSDLACKVREVLDGGRW
jgi:PAS domain S-box-containing protein